LKTPEQIFNLKSPTACQLRAVKMEEVETQDSNLLLSYEPLMDIKRLSIKLSDRYEARTGSSHET
jgi:hypothetical protein